MSITPERYAERRRMMLLAPLMIASNLFLFSCMIGLGAAALRESRSVLSPMGGEVQQRIVQDYLAEKLPDYRYRIRQWFPATPLEGTVTAATGELSPSVTKKGFAQRVQLVFYGPSGARQLDTVYWIQNGQVTRTLAVDPHRAVEL